MQIVAAVIVMFASLAGVGLNIVALPGIWFSIGVSMLCWWWQPELFSPWTIGAVVALGVLAELCEFFAGAVGARAAGGRRLAALAAIGGGIAGAIIGTGVVPVLGTLVGGACGAGLAAGLVGAAPAQGESDEQPRPTRVRIGRGAATGWLLAVLLKTGFSALIGVVLTVAAFVP